jgi:hypothetical protein
MQPLVEPGIWQTLGTLAGSLGTLFVQLSSLGMHWVLWILWVVWWLFAVNWKKGCSALSIGGWAPLVLLMLLTSLVWSQLQPSSADWGFVTLPNFWWQLGYVGMLVGIAFICGWLQGVYHLAPAELDLNPPAHGHGHHDHGHHGHEHEHSHDSHATTHASAASHH